MTGHGFEPVAPTDNASEFGLALFQLVVREVDTRVQCRPGDLVATLAFLTGRIVQRSAFHEAPHSFLIDRSANGALVMRSDWVTNRLGTLEPGSLASVLVDCAVQSGARTFPDFAAVRQDAFEAMQRRGTFELRGHILTATPEELAAEVQSDVDGLLFDAADRTLLIHASINACGHAIGYSRHRLPPVEAAELALSVAYYAGWVDQRKIGRAQLRS